MSATNSLRDVSSSDPTAAVYPAELRMRAASLRQWAADECAAKVYDQVAEELERILRREEDHVLTLAEASLETGYNAEHLGRQVRAGKIPNAGRKNAPRIRRGDLPHKARKLRAGTAIAGEKVERYDPVADARFLLSRRGVQ